MNSWIMGGGNENQIVLSSRIRLARNIADIPFPPSLDSKNAKKIVDLVTNVKSLDCNSNGNYKLYSMNEISALDRQVLVERYLISPNMTSHQDIGAVLVKEDEVVSIMLNEEDHIRIQAILPGMQLREAYEIANEIDDNIEATAEYAFDESWGYLTSCPTNVGTGLRASVMIHLPALTLTTNVNKILQAVTRIGLTIRGLYGEGTEFVGNIFQISNQITLGRQEEELIENLFGVSSQIIEKEKEARRMLLSNNKLMLEDKIWRSLAIMKNARIMKLQESMRLLSNVRLGIDLGIIDMIPYTLLNEIMVNSQTASLQKYAGEELGNIEKDVLRAEVIRNKISQGV